MIYFKQINPLNLNLATGQLSDKFGSPAYPESTPAVAPNIGISPEDFMKQLIPLKTKNVPIDKVLRAIDLHPKISDKETAKKMASDFYRSESPELDKFNFAVDSFAGKSVEATNEMKDKVPLREYQYTNIPSEQVYEGKIGDEIRDVALKSYPFNDATKSIIQNETFVGKHFGDVPFAGANHPEINADRIPFGNEVMNLELLRQSILKAVPEWLQKKTGRKSIVEVQDKESSTAAHEFIHAIVEKKYGDNFFDGPFNKTWEEAKKSFDGKVNPYSEIDKNLEEYPDLTDYGRANERFAYMGGFLGMGGLNNFPEQFKKYYAGVFSILPDRSLRNGAGQSVPGTEEQKVLSSGAVNRVEKSKQVKTIPE